MTLAACTPGAHIALFRALEKIMSLHVIIFCMFNKFKKQKEWLANALLLPRAAMLPASAPATRRIHSCKTYFLPSFSLLLHNSKWFTQQKTPLAQITYYNNYNVSSRTNSIAFWCVTWRRRVKQAFFLCAHFFYPNADLFSCYLACHQQMSQDAMNIH